MTVIVGVKCTDGIVIGSDGVATSSYGPQPLIKLEYPHKISKISSDILVAASGSIGLSSRFSAHVTKAQETGSFRKNGRLGSIDIATMSCQDFSASGVPRTTHQGYGITTLLAARFSDDVHLIEFGLLDFQPEIKTSPLHFVSIGSGQNLADPFLAFVNRVIWKNEKPNISMGLLGVYWVLKHTCDFAHGLVGPPIKVGVLRNQNGWNASILEDADLGQLAQHVQELENRIGDEPGRILASAKDSLPPEPPKLP